jgi:hypothetical protein
MKKYSENQQKKLKIGEYFFEIDKAGHIVEWEVYLGNDDFYMTKNQDAAEIISRLINIERLLKARRNKK